MHRSVPLLTLLLSAPMAMAHDGEHFHLHPHGLEGLAIAAIAIVTIAFAYREGWLPQAVYTLIGRDHPRNRR